MSKIPEPKPEDLPAVEKVYGDARAVVMEAEQIFAAAGRLDQKVPGYRLTPRDCLLSMSEDIWRASRGLAFLDGSGTGRCYDAAYAVSRASQNSQYSVVTSVLFNLYHLARDTNQKLFRVARGYPEVDAKEVA